MTAATTTLIIDTADLASLVAVAMQRDAEQFVLWHPKFNHVDAEIRHDLARRHSSIFGAERFVVTQLNASPLPSTPADTWWTQSELLVHGLGIASRLGCSRVIWPHQVGSDFADVSPVVDRATLISGLCPSPDGMETVIIDLPLLDLTDDQIIDLADDSGADLSLHWPCEHAGETPCGSCQRCRRWVDAFERVGPTWPWAAMTAV